MWNILADIVNAGAVSLSVSGSDKPINSNTTIEPTSDAGIAIILLSIVVAVLLAVIIFLLYRNSKKAEKIKALSKTKTETNTQDNILNLYKSLNSEEKAIVENIIKKFSDKEQN